MLISKYSLRLFLVQLVCMNLALAEDSSSQDLQKVKLTLSVSNASLTTVLQEIEAKTDFVFAYSEEIKTINKSFHLNYHRASLKAILVDLATQTNLEFKRINNTISVKPGNEVIDTTDANPLSLIVSGKVNDEANVALPGVNVLLKGTNIGVVTDVEGKFVIEVPDESTQNAILVFSFIGYATQEVSVSSQSVVNVTMKPDIQSLSEVVVVGYGTKKKEALTGSVATVNSDDLGRVAASTTSGLLAGKLPGVSFRMPDGRPGAGAWLQIRNMGNPLFVIDGIQKDAGQFNNIAPNDIESISVLKDASASIYGSRAANGVVIVTTKKGKTGTKSTVNINSYYGVQNWSRFPKGVTAYDWMLGKADAEMNMFGSTNITAEELEKYKAGTEDGYKSFDWYDFIVKKNSPQYSVNANASGGSENINFYFSASHLFQNSVLGREFTFQRTNFQSNIDAKVIDKLKVGVQLNGRLETRDNPGVPGGDDYWAPRFALFRNRPTERPYANDNPLYPKNIGHNTENWALQTKAISGYWHEDWRVLQANFNAEYELPIKGLTVKGLYSSYTADRLMNGHEYTYDVYDYDKTTDTYYISGGSSNPWRERGTHKVLETVTQGQVNYNNSFGKHTVGATFVAERIERDEFDVWVHSVPKTNALPLLLFADIDTYNDSEVNSARAGYVLRFNYEYAGKYYFEFAGRRDASSAFVEGQRWGSFPSVSAGWRVTEEQFFKNLGIENVLDNFKLRASYGKLGDDNVGLDQFSYIVGYTYPAGPSIMNGNLLNTTRQNRAVPITNISWITSNMTDIGADYSLFGGKLTGTLDYFKRVRKGIPYPKNDVIPPAELGYQLPQENLNTDMVMGGEGSLAYHTNIGSLEISLGGNFSYARFKNGEIYNPQYGNSWNHYRNGAVDRWGNIQWGYQVIGQFQSVDQINSYPVNIDGQGNTTLLPGDFIYKDVNNDGLINGYDERPIGYGRGQTPTINYGLTIGLMYRNFDFTADMSGASMYSYNQNWELRWPYQNGGNLLAAMYDDRWHRADPLDIASEWIPGKNPPLRFNTPGHSNYNKDSDWWMTNQTYLRLRTMELGYTLPSEMMARVKITKLRVYVNTYNLFSIDNVKQLGIDPEIADENGLQYPQNKFFNVGFNLTF